MSQSFKKAHVFTAELPYEKDAAVTDYLRNHFEKVDNFVMSLGQMANIPPSTMESYINGQKIDSFTFGKSSLNAGGPKLYLWLLPSAILRVSIDLIKALGSIDFKCDVFFAQHFLPALIAVILRRLKILKCPKIIFWMFDFFLVPPDFLRGLYFRGIDLAQQFIRKNVDEMWYTTPRIRESDRIRYGELPSNVKVQLTEGCFFKRISVPQPPKIPPISLAFLGSLRLNNAVYESMHCVKYCLEQGIKIELHIIGSGPEEKRMREYVTKNKLTKAVIFYGFEDRGKEIAKIFSQCHFGLCLYAADAYGPNWYLTSGKFRRFVSQGLPIITTPVPYFVKYIHEYKAGLIVDNNPADIYRALLPFYKKPRSIKTLRTGVDKLYNAYKIEAVFNQAFNETEKNKK